MATLEELINRMYDMVQDAKGIPLAGEKCIVERDHMLDMLDELREALPNDLQQAQEIVAKRSEMLASGKREAEAIRRQAEEDARQMVSETEIVVAARRKAKEVQGNAEIQARELRRVANEHRKVKTKCRQSPSGGCFFVSFAVPAQRKFVACEANGTCLPGRGTRGMDT